MKKQLLFIILIVGLSACNLFHKSEKYGCPTNGRNVDAGKLAVDDPKAKADAKKAKKYDMEKAPVTN